jgi:hypothetical protein
MTTSKQADGEQQMSPTNHARKAMRPYQVALVAGFIGFGVGFPLGLISYPLGLVVSAPQSQVVDTGPKASFDKPCLALDEDAQAMNTFQPREIEKADFCSPDGAPVQFVAVSDEGSWRVSEPWRDSDHTIQHRLAFSRKKESTSTTSFVIHTTTHLYVLTVTAAQI